MAPFTTGAALRESDGMRGLAAGGTSGGGVDGAAGAGGAAAQQQHGNSSNSSGNGGHGGGADADTSTYALLGCVCHAGEISGGHYIAYVRAGRGEWFCCDDALVTRVAADTVRACQPYMLFYLNDACHDCPPLPLPGIGDAAAQEPTVGLARGGAAAGGGGRVACF
ncbi:hypothetical protein FOA52_003980 [Chlamydomonas sp. UWO 241]|nr:hypothetical protein FOA52_003980 [Chlamydomonas sp. UWO 241]